MSQISGMRTAWEFPLRNAFVVRIMGMPFEKVVVSTSES